MSAHEKLPVMLIPGLQCDRRVWQLQIPFIEALGHEVIVPDGHFSAESIADMAEIVARQLPEKAHVAGWSMGGYVLCRLLSTHARQIASVAMIATSAQPENARRTTERRAAMMSARRLGMEKAYRASLEACCFRPENVPTALMDDLVAMGCDLGIETFFSQQAAIIARADGRPALASYKGPVTIICGDEDAVTPPEFSQEMHDIAAGSQLLMIPQAGHNAPIERPDAVNAALAKWLGAGPATHDQPHAAALS
ncbi:alpha/beta fold hydrolase [Martelella lutilitoris]|nr:alpha/beta hydrolase [Martelella lutilitoris]